VSTEDQRRVLLSLVALLGATCSWPEVSAYVPGLSRQQGREMLNRIQKGWAWAQRVGLRLLRWVRPGWVWALDFLTPPNAVEGHYPRILAVRDLASGKMLLTLPCLDETAQTAVSGLSSLFAEHGPPLVLKMDNGSAQRSGDMCTLLRSFSVTALFSPARTPRYNGAVEAGIGSLKTRAHHLAAAAGRPEEWTLDDVEEARCVANDLGRPAGASGPTPEERWRDRVPILPAHRHDFRLRIARALRGLRLSDPAEEARPGRSRRDALRRAAITRALTDMGLLQFRTRRIPPPVSSSIRPVIS
jgi:hypothetical protein